MKKDTKKSSITLPARELKLVLWLMKMSQAQSKVDVIRKALHLLKNHIDRKELQRAYLEASKATQASLKDALEELDHLSSEGIE